MQAFKLQAEVGELQDVKEVTQAAVASLEATLGRLERAEAGRGARAPSARAPASGGSRASSRCVAARGGGRAHSARDAW